ncbi:hypothetical protein EV44_g1230 [Erysiphe necator]|uniref:Uncharacterized protein n=1 Tax=Uncinula necator TaxID=52586 RepID=A0A0B1P779_UNCNE|nr:hypothetical protein EV44_g1230 [Erysiphe necator]
MVLRMEDLNPFLPSKLTGPSSIKKFRKMKIKFDEAMQQNKELFFDEQRGIQTAKRIALQNDQILDILYDMNNSSRIPAEKRIDLTAESPYLSEIPTLVSSHELSKVSQLQTPEGKKLYDEICNMIAARELSKPPRATQKSLALLLASIPHLDSKNPHLPEDVLISLEPEEGQKTPYSYITSDQLDEFYHEIDTSLGETPITLRPPTQETSQDSVFENFHSPYNWLRRNVPQIFLQDGECSEKSSGKPGALRGAGKRVNIPAPSKPDSLEIVEEDGLGYDFKLGASKERERKRKRNEEDHGFNVKKGAFEETKAKKPRQARKKKGEGLEDKGSNVKKAKKLKVISSPPSGHPFGPA